MSLFMTEPLVTMLPEPKRGTVEKPITSGARGRVKAMGSYWFAELYQPDKEIHLLPGEPILVIGIKNITLLVIPTS